VLHVDSPDTTEEQAQVAGLLPCFGVLVGASSCLERRLATTPNSLLLLGVVFQ